MKNPLPTNEVELTTSSPHEAEAQEHKPIPTEQIQDSDLGEQIIIMIQKESFQPPRQQTLDVVERFPNDHADEKRRQTDTLTQSEKKLDSSLSVRELLPGVRIDEAASSSVQLIDEVPSLIEEKAAGLQAFLSSLGITFEDLQRLDIPEEPLRQLFQQETACTAAFKWSRFER